MNKLFMVVLVGLGLVLTGCNQGKTQEAKDAKMVQMQQSQYSKSQPVPNYNWSLERHLLIELYNLRNQKAATHSVWRSDYGQVEGDCTSIGFGMPYDTSLTNPLVSTTIDQDGYERGHGAMTSIEQAEPNGIFASKNTSATWVMCAGEYGSIEPVYIETKVTVYPYPVDVDYENNRVTKAGKASVSISSN